MKCLAASALVILLAAGAATAQNLTYEQRQACDRQERNQKEGAAKLESLLKGFEKNADALSRKPELLVPPAFIKTYVGAADDVLRQCDNVVADLDKSSCPAGNPRVKALQDWSAEARKSAEKVKADVAPKLAAMEKLADPKSYPELDADFAQIDTLARSYSIKDLHAQPARVVELAKQLVQAATWANEKYAAYRPLMVVTGGKESAYYRRAERMTEAIKQFQAASKPYVEESKQVLAEHLKKAETMAAEAAEKQQPGLLTGGVRQQLELAEARLDVWRALVAEDDADVKAMDGALAAAKQKSVAIGAALKEQIIAGERPPADAYTGGDKETIRKEIAARWREAWPQDEILTVRLHMKEFDRRESATWEPASKSWRFEDRSTLCATVIVKTSATLATSYPAYVNVDNLAKSTTYGVKTKGSGYVIREMLVANVK